MMTNEIHNLIEAKNGKMDHANNGNQKLNWRQQKGGKFWLQRRSESGIEKR